MRTELRMLCECTFPPTCRTSRVVLQAQPLMAATKQVHSLAVHASVSGGARRLAWWYRLGGKQ